MKKAIVLAGGKGTRLHPVTLEIPKPLVTVNKKPIINYLINLFADHGVEEVKVIIRPQDREEFAWWLKRWKPELKSVKISFAEEPKAMGTIGYWVHALREWTGDEPFFLSNGDELKEVNLKEMAAHHKKLGGLATIALVSVSNPQEYGVAVLDKHHIIKFLEKPKDPPSDFISSGLYILEPAIINYLSGSEFLMVEKDLFPHLAKDRKLIAYKSSGQWFDCGSLDRWEQAIREWGA